MTDQNTRSLVPELHVRGQIVQLEHSYQSVLANCEFCNQAYRFDRVDMASLFKAHAKAPSRQQ